MKIIENQTFDQERALYGSNKIKLVKCFFDGPADGESALKESSNVELDSCFCNLRYPFWHDHRLKITNSELTDLCRAAIWYSDNIDISNSQLHGIKALRECRNVNILDTDIISPEFGWSVTNVSVMNTTARSEYFFMRSKNIAFDNVTFTGKYSFQYIQNGMFSNCNFDTKDAFWHSKNVTVKNSTIKGEYLAWYADGLTLINCKIIGTQPLCYCTNLKLIDCQMIDTDLSFERSDVNATLTEPIISIKNPLSGKIRVPSANDIIFDEPCANGIVICGDKICRRQK